jgi:hypothetical protein
MAEDNRFTITLSQFYQGFSPLAHLNNLTQVGNAGSASVMSNVDVLGDLMTQGPALSNLTNGTQAGVVSELINFIIDKAVASDTTYGIGTTKLFKISSTAVASGGTPSWPQAITNCVDGESVIQLGTDIYGFYNKSSGGDILKMPLSTEVIDVDWGSTTPTGAAALQKAVHPVAVKEDVMIFGNGQYLGTYIGGSNTLAPTKLDFGVGNEVADVIFFGNQWLIAVNSGITGSNKNFGQIYTYDGGALSSILSDEVGIGFQKIGFLFEHNGVVYVAYQDLSSSGGYKIGYLAGRQIKTLAHFTGSLPSFSQKTLYKNTILFASSGSLYSAGAIVDEFPFAISQLADGGYTTLGAVVAPFGTPMIASTDGATNYRLAKFSGYDTACSWKSVVIPLVQGRTKGFIDEIIVLTKALGANASCSLKLEYNQGVSTSSANLINTTGRTRHTFRISIPNVEDFRIFLDWSGGSGSNDVAIREIQIIGHFVQC